MAEFRQCWATVYEDKTLRPSSKHDEHLWEFSCKVSYHNVKSRTNLLVCMYCILLYLGACKPPLAVVTILRRSHRECSEESEKFWGNRLKWINQPSNLWICGKVIFSRWAHNCRGESSGCPCPGGEKVKSISRTNGPERERETES